MLRSAQRRVRQLLPPVCKWPPLQESAAAPRKRLLVTEAARPAWLVDAAAQAQAVQEVDSSLLSKAGSSLFNHLHEPVVVREAARHWAAVHKWSVDYLRLHAGTELVDVEISVNGGDYRDAFVEADKDGREFYKLSMRMDDYLNYFLSKRQRCYQPESGLGREGTTYGYVAQDSLLEKNKTLSGDLQIPSFVPQPYQAKFWFGPNGAKTPLHRDPYSNVYVQVFGRKQWFLFDAAHEESLYVFEQPLVLRNTSQVRQVQEHLSGIVRPQYE